MKRVNTADISEDGPKGVYVAEGMVRAAIWSAAALGFIAALRLGRRMKGRF